MRADFRCVSSAEGERYVWEQELEGTPFERHLQGLAGRDRAARAGRRDRGQPQLGADAERDVAARLAADAPRPGRDPRRGARRDREGADVSGDAASAGRDATRSGGGGGTRRSSRRSTPRRSAVLRERIGELEPWPLARELEEFELPAARAAAAGADRGGGGGERLHAATRTGCGTRPAAATSTWRGCATARSRPPPTRSLMPPDAEALRRVIDVCAAEGVAIVPFGGGTSVVGGVEPLRGDHERLVSLDLGALREVEVDRRSLTARLGAGLRGPEAEAALGPRGPHPRPLPAVLRVRDDRRLRRDPLRRPGLERLRALRRAGQLGPPARAGRRDLRPWRRRTPPPARRCASW